MGRYHLLLIEGKSKKDDAMKGKTDTNKTVILERVEVP
jgi:hypothetical protein